MTKAKRTVRDEYGASAAQWDSTFNATALNRIHAASCWRAFRKAIGSGYRTSVAVELGVGTGLFTDRISSEFDELIAVDFSQEMLDALALKLTACGIANVKYLHADAANLLTLPDASVDVVCCFGLLEDIADSKALFTEINRVLRPRGRFAGVASNRSCPWYPIRRIIAGDRWYWNGARLYSATELRAAARSVKLVERNIFGWGVVPSQFPNWRLLAPFELAERILEATPLARFLGGLAFCFEKV